MVTKLTMAMINFYMICVDRVETEASFGGLGAVAPSKEKEKRKKERKKEKKRKKEEKKKERRGL